MDLKHLLTLERRQLQHERHRLNAANNNNNNNNDTNQSSENNTDYNANNSAETCPAALLLQMPDFEPVRQCQRMNTALSIHSEGNEPTSATSALATASQNSTPSTPRSYTVYTAAAPEADCAATVLANELHLDLTDVLSEEAQPESAAISTTLHKSAKELVNQRELLVGSARRYKSPNVSPCNAESCRSLSENRLPTRRSKEKDDMEQWVTDTFYSYFPGFNNENQKRQNYLRERQRENQQNFLKHQMLHPPQKNAKHAHQRIQPQAKQVQQQPNEQPSTITTRSGHSTTSTKSSTTDKTDLELIVNNNPNYVAPKTTTTYQQSKIRPGTTRHRLLQDLGHVELSNIVTGDGIMERNMRSAELETARKKDYQRDLMQQIEEKQRAIEMLREKERRQDEALTRRLEAQLKTIQLEEQLEKKRLQAEKARNDADQQRVLREQLLAKLERDAQLLRAKQKQNNNLATAAPSADQQTNADSVPCNEDANKVYKYFSNSAHHEYRRGQPLPPAVELEFELPQMAKIERECFHLSEKICPFCDEPLKSYESCCLRCQRKLAVKIKQRDSEQQSADKEADNAPEQQQQQQSDDNQLCHSSYALVCLKCERLYALCPSCLAKNDICRACQRERNVCMNCRRTLCSFCLEEVACGRDVERTHVNEKEAQSSQQDADAFRVLEVNYAVPAVTEAQEPNLQHSPDSEQADVSSPSPPYSMHIARNSVFHNEYKPTPDKQSFMDQLPTTSGSANTSFDLDSADEQSMERVRRHTNQRLTRYLQNYGDLASSFQQRSRSESRNRGTQTTPQSALRRDVVMYESSTHNLSMPLLREMPKMTRQETTLMAQINQRKIENLKKRWEVPAVQKFTVSTTSPKILTQVGAMRQQLQAARYFDEEVDE